MSLRRPKPPIKRGSATEEEEEEEEEEEDMPSTCVNSGYKGDNCEDYCLVGSDAI